MAGFNVITEDYRIDESRKEVYLIRADECGGDPDDEDENTTEF
jgi:hypothetical protein